MFSSFRNTRKAASNTAATMSKTVAQIGTLITDIFNETSEDRRTINDIIDLLRAANSEIKRNENKFHKHELFNGELIQPSVNNFKRYLADFLSHKRDLHYAVSKMYYKLYTNLRNSGRSEYDNYIRLYLYLSYMHRYVGKKIAFQKGYLTANLTNMDIKVNKSVYIYYYGLEKFPLDDLNTYILLASKFLDKIVRWWDSHKIIGDPTVQPPFEASTEDLEIINNFPGLILDQLVAWDGKGYENGKENVSHYIRYINRISAIVLNEYNNITHPDDPQYNLLQNKHFKYTSFINDDPSVKLNIAKIAPTINNQAFAEELLESNKEILINKQTTHNHKILVMDNVDEIINILTLIPSMYSNFYALMPNMNEMTAGIKEAGDCFDLSTLTTVVDSASSSEVGLGTTIIKRMGKYLKSIVSDDNYFIYNFTDIIRNNDEITTYTNHNENDQRNKYLTHTFSEIKKLSEVVPLFQKDGSTPFTVTEVGMTPQMFKNLDITIRSKHIILHDLCITKLPITKIITHNEIINLIDLIDAKSREKNTYKNIAYNYHRKMFPDTPRPDFLNTKNQDLTNYFSDSINFMGGKHSKKRRQRNKTKKK